MQETPQPGSMKGTIYQPNALGEYVRRGYAVMVVHCLTCRRTGQVPILQLIKTFPWGPATPLDAVARSIGPCRGCGAKGGHVEPYTPGYGMPGYSEWLAAQLHLAENLLRRNGRWPGA